MKIPKKAHLVYCTISKQFMVTGMPMQKEFPQYIDVVDVDVEFEVPKDFLSGGAELEGLKRKRADVADRASNELIQIDKQINALQKIKNAD